MLQIFSFCGVTTRRVKGQIIGCFTFSCKRKSLFFKEGGQSNTKVRERDKNKISLSVADFLLVFLLLSLI